MSDGKEQMQEIWEQLEKGVSEVFTSENYIRFLDMLSQFHSYSVNNCILILSQYPAATRVKTYTADYFCQRDVPLTRKISFLQNKKQ